MIIIFAVIALAFTLLGLEIGYSRIKDWAKKQYPTVRRDFIIERFDKSGGLTFAIILATSVFVLCLFVTGVIS